MVWTDHVSSVRAPAADMCMEGTVPLSSLALQRTQSRLNVRLVLSSTCLGGTAGSCGHAASAIGVLSR